MFFVLSGFGAYFSLGRRFPESSVASRALLVYYADRFLRVYPMYVIALVLMGLLKHASYSPFAYMGLIGPEIYWFVAAIIQCFVVAPFLFFLLRKVGYVKFLLFATALMLAANAARVALTASGVDGSSGVQGVIFALMPQYHNVWLANIFLFAAGMALPDSLKRIAKSTPLIIASVVAYLSLLYISRGFIFPWPYENIVPSLLFIIASVAVPAFLIAGDLKSLPLAKFVADAGRNSYSIYLFHMVYYLAVINICGGYNRTSIYVIIALYPIFFLLIGQVEKGQGDIVRNITKRLS